MKNLPFKEKHQLKILLQNFVIQNMKRCQWTMEIKKRNKNVYKADNRMVTI